MEQLICIPIVARTNASAIGQIRKANRLKVADLIELRLDFIRNANVAKLIKACKKPVIATCRPKRELGAFRGTENRRVALLEIAILQNAAYIDIELTTGRSNIGKLIMLRNLSNSKTRFILSHHSAKPLTFTAIKKIFLKMKKQGFANAYKIVSCAEKESDCIATYEFLNFARKTFPKEKIISFNCGKVGKVSRILARAFGSFISYCPLSAEEKSADGQIEIAKFPARVKEKTKIIMLLGNPVEHSLSPLIYNNAFEKLKMNVYYTKICLENFQKEFRRLAKLGIHGFSITVPFKEKAVAHLDRMTNVVKETGAVNTIINNCGELYGFNTDCIGVVNALQKITGIKGKNAAIFGAGGTAKAFGYGLLKEGCTLTIINRSTKKGIKLAKKLGAKFLQLRKFPAKPIPDFDILLNATSVGMKIKATIIPFGLLKKLSRNRPIVVDAVYTPYKSAFVKNAEKLRLKTISGAEILAEQAVSQFKIFTGKKAGFGLLSAPLMGYLR